MAWFAAKRPFAILIAAAAALPAATSAAAQDKTFDLRFSHWVPPTHPLQKAMEEWGASIEKASNGTLKFKVYPSQQLGKAFDHYDMARDGIADFTSSIPATSPAASRSSPPANCRSSSAMPRAAIARSTPGTANMRQPR